MKIEIFENTNSIMAKNTTYIDPIDPVLEKVADTCYILSFKELEVSFMRTLVYFSDHYTKSYLEIDNKRYSIENIPGNFDKINALLEKYKLSSAIEKLP